MLVKSNASSFILVYHRTAFVVLKKIVIIFSDNLPFQYCGIEIILISILFNGLDTVSERPSYVER